MIQAEFAVKDGKTVGFSICGHALFDEYGRDIVCASVSSAVQLTANGITEIIGQQAEVQVTENRITLTLPEHCDNEMAFYFMDALKLHLTLLSEDYLETMKITISEV